MTPDAGRRDAVIILARGRSRRMGRPKGLIAAPGGGVRLAEAVWEPYRTRGWPGVLIARTAEAESYAAALGAAAGLRVAAAPDGGETAATVFAGWRELCHGDAAPPTHLWLHPVDLPEVGTTTIDLLHAASERQPDRVCRPLWQGRPGHPVVAPAAALSAVADRRAGWPGPWRDLLELEDVLRPVQVAVQDGGVCRDYDTPQALAEARRDEERGVDP
jgi:molybdenum cofactor cytidylyltransferase